MDLDIWSIFVLCRVHDWHSLVRVENLSILSLYFLGRLLWSVHYLGLIRIYFGNNGLLLCVILLVLIFKVILSAISCPSEVFMRWRGVFISIIIEIYLSLSRPVVVELRWLSRVSSVVVKGLITDNFDSGWVYRRVFEISAQYREVELFIFIFRVFGVLFVLSWRGLFWTSKVYLRLLEMLRSSKWRLLRSSFVYVWSWLFVNESGFWVKNRSSTG
jgi:hypothetical protein